MNGTQELVTILPWTFIAQILNLFIQLYLIKRFLFRPIHAVLEKRKALADGQLEDARIARRDAENLKSGYEARLLTAKTEATRLLQNAQTEIIRAAREEAAGLKSKAEADILQEKKKAINEIKHEIGSIAMEIAGKVVEREISAEDHQKLIDEFIENVGEAS